MYDENIHPENFERSWPVDRSGHFKAGYLRIVNCRSIVLNLCLKEIRQRQNMVLRISFQECCIVISGDTIYTRVFHVHLLCFPHFLAWLNKFRSHPSLLFVRTPRPLPHNCPSNMFLICRVYSDPCFTPYMIFLVLSLVCAPCFLPLRKFLAYLPYFPLILNIKWPPAIIPAWNIHHYQYNVPI